MRIPIAISDTYAEAVEIKLELMQGFPEKTFQIRKKQKKFAIVERVASTPEKSNPSKKRKKNRGISF